MKSLKHPSIRICITGLCLFALTVSGAFAGTKKISAIGNPGQLVSFKKMSIDDNTKHYISLVRRSDTDVCSNDLFGTLKVDTIVFSDYRVGGTGTQNGYRIFTHASGDKIFFTFKGTTSVIIKKDGTKAKRYKFKGKWHYTGGTGQFEGITGKGTYKGKLADKGVEFDWKGNYKIPSAKK
ncbi:MAG: hypothetical protein KAQ76_00470 [Elusimicrobiales bacterium]|nr:hypothetical protein [Elusimicrobiales bacterium]